MAITFRIDNSTDPCDVCEDHSTNDGKTPKVYIRQKSKGSDANFICVHVHCLLKKVGEAIIKAVR